MVGCLENRFILHLIRLPRGHGELVLHNSVFVECRRDVLVPGIFVSMSDACFIACSLVGRHRWTSSRFSHQLYAAITWYLLEFCGSSGNCTHTARQIGLSRGSRLNWISCKGSASWPLNHTVVQETPPSWRSASLSCSIRIELLHAKSDYPASGGCHNLQGKRIEGQKPVNSAQNIVLLARHEEEPTSSRQRCCVHCPLRLPSCLRFSPALTLRRR